MAASPPAPPSPERELPSARNRLENLLLRWTRWLLGRLPVPWVPALGSGFGWAVYRLTGFARRRTLGNLDIAFGSGMPPAQRRAAALRCYRHFGATLFEFLVLPRLTGPEVLERIDFANRAVLDTALAQGKGVILFGTHFGGWELLDAGLAAAGYPLTVYTGGQRNTLVDGQINEIRQATGQATVGRHPGGVRGLLRALRAGRIVALAADQHESTKRHYVSFFGQPVSVAPGPYQLARHSGAPALFANTVRTGSFRYRCTFEALRPPDPERDEERDLLEFTQQAFALLERDVRAHPDHYFWMHRRFRPIPREVVLSAANREFLASRLGAPVDAFWEAEAEPPAEPGRP